MNRSVLLVVCDFFILTLLSFVKFDGGPEGPPPTREPLASEVAAAGVSNMVASLETALELERQRREALTNELAATSAQLSERLRALAEREQALSNAERRLSQSELQAKKLADERARLEAAHGAASASVRELQKAFETARESSGSLQTALTDSVREAAAAKARLEVMEEELNRRREDAKAMQEQISKLDETQERLKEEKHQLALELTETATEARVVRQAVTNLSQQLVQAGVEKTQILQTAAQLATNASTLASTLATNVTALATNVTALATNVTSIATDVTALAEKSTAIKEQMDRQIRYPANTIYGGFLSNRVRVDSSGTTRGGLGQEVARRKEGATVLVRIKGRVYAVLHVESTALRLWPPDSPWSALGADVSRGGRRARSPEFQLARRDPRVVAIAVDEAEANVLGATIYEAATDPAQFAEAVVVGGEENYYGECAFHLSAENPGYVQMERSTIRRLLGEFAPRRGDLALSKTGKFLGILVNSDHCLLVEDLEFLPALRCGERLDVAANSAVLRMAQGTVERLASALK